ncbi:MAG: histone deacetylase family protein [bacterium]|nr:histone deacetylase family protein [bacterium]MDE0643275.1 histone deacetylase family protein [bacterium]
MRVYSHPDHRLHDPVQPQRFGGVMLPPLETAHRADRILKALAAQRGFDVQSPPEIDDQVLRLVHRPDYLEFLESAHSRWRAETGAPAEGDAVAYIRPLLDGIGRKPTHVYPQLGFYSNDVDSILEGTWRAARSAAASALAVARDIHEGNRVAYAICRPPGHHAAAGTFGGFCYLNNTALAAAWLTDQGHRVAVLDVDTHHGNGTQSIFWQRGDVLTVSIHGDPEVHYPFFAGFEEERGEGEGLGTNLNLPLPTGSPWKTYVSVLDQALQAVHDFGAEVLVVALGVDTHIKDGVLGLQDGDYPHLGRSLAQSDLPMVVIQEGGYSPGVLEAAVPAVLSAMGEASS